MSEVAVVEHGSPSGESRPTAYAAFIHWKRVVAAWVEQGQPSTIQGLRYWQHLSSSGRSQVRRMMLALGLIDDSGAFSPDFYRVAEAPPDRRGDVMRPLFQEAYDDVLCLGPEVSRGEVEERFAARGIKSEATIQKAVNFFLAMADEVGVVVSPELRVPLPTAVLARPSYRQSSVRPLEAGRRTASRPEMPVDPISSVEQQRAEYVELLLGMLRGRDANMPIDDNLLDRIERVIGITPLAANSGENDNHRLE